ncbi:oxidoreductase [Nostocoides vanveenii]|uniref:Oxidoreductase n=1 Tax=Nostocoides vanveenii TaxID=330835 RepID=A0ABP4WR49_9MICO
MAKWTASDIPDQSGRLFVITGANSGIGLEAAKSLCAIGAHVVFACRNMAKADAARADIAGSHEARQLDLSDLDSVRAFAADFGDRKIDVLINNAGIMAIPKSLSPQGHELQFATNVLGHFLLTALLLPQVTDRVVTLSSQVHRAGKVDVSDPDFANRRYNPWLAYAQSKLADLMLAYELQRRLTADRSPIRSMAAHPGYSATNLQSKGGSLQSTLMGLANRLPFVAQPAAMGALPTLYAATVPDLPGGSYIGPDGIGEMGGHPRPVGSSGASHDRAVARHLWELCERLTAPGS